MNIFGQASYQSAVTQIPIEIPNNPIRSLSKDQYRLYGELSQLVFDGGTIKAIKEGIQTNIPQQSPAGYGDHGTYCSINSPPVSSQLRNKECDHSTYSQRLISTIPLSGYFRLTGYTDSFAEALALLEKDKADLILEIPAGFERNLIRELHQEVFIAVNAIN